MYSPDATEVSKKHLVVLANSLKSYHDDFVLVGGWAPYFITQSNPNFEHIGSLDIDLALKTEILDQYDTIREIIESLGYSPLNLFKFEKWVTSHHRTAPQRIVLDLLCEKDGAKLFGTVVEVQKELHAFAFEGLSIAFDFNYEEEIQHGITIKVVDLVGSLALKGKSLYERRRDDKRQKDAYDIFALTHLNGGPMRASEYFNQTVSSKKTSPGNQKRLKTSLGYISLIFSDVDQDGPKLVESYCAPDTTYNKYIVAAQMNQFLKRLKLPFD